MTTTTKCVYDMSLGPEHITDDYKTERRDLLIHDDTNDEIRRLSFKEHVLKWWADHPDATFDVEESKFWPRHLDLATVKRLLDEDRIVPLDVRVETATDWIFNPWSGFLEVFIAGRLVSIDVYPSVTTHK